MRNPITFAPGAVIGQRYRLVTPLGKGAMGEVWRAEHIGLGSPVALKLIDPELLSESAVSARAELFDRFEREARAAASMQSVHVVQVMDHGLSGGVPYIAMELLNGETLAQRLERLGRLSPEKTVAVLTHVGRAMTRAHDLGVVHRDLKPENVFLVKNEDDELAKVLDFGIAKLARSPLDIDQRATTTGQLIGTPCYMSPEQASGGSGLDHRSDLWAMAVIAYECLTGELPFLSTNIGDLVLSICTRPLPVPSAKFAGLPPAFDAWWARAAAREPGDRFQSARELVDGLRLALLDAGPLPSSPGRGEAANTPTLTAAPRGAMAATEAGVSTNYRARATSARQWWPLFLVAAVAAAVVGFFTLRVRRERPAPLAEPPRESAAGSASAPAGTGAENPIEIAPSSASTPAPAVSASEAATSTPSAELPPVPSSSAIASASAKPALPAKQPRPSGTGRPPSKQHGPTTVDPRLGL